jgi:hypothetical protein
LLLLYAGATLGQTAEVTHNVNLRSDPSTTNPPIRLLTPPEQVELLEPGKTNGYYHVLLVTPTPAPTPAGPTPTPAPGVTPSPPPTPSGVATPQYYRMRWEMRKLASQARLLLPAILGVVLFIGSASTTKAQTSPEYQAPPDGLGGGGSCYVDPNASACEKCKANCDCTWQSNIRRCDGGLLCLEMASAEHDACLGNCTADKC